jgi:hypothetical protein
VNTSLLDEPADVVNAGGVGGIAADDHALAFFTYLLTSVWRADPTGTSPTPLDTAHQSVWNTVLDGNGVVYWTGYVSGTSGPGYIGASNVDGGVLYEPITGNSNVAATRSGFFFNFKNGAGALPGLVRVSPDGGATQLVSPDQDNTLYNFVWVTADSQNVYWIQQTPAADVWMVAQGGGTASPLVSTSGIGSTSGASVLRIASFGSTVYWFDASGVIHWVPIVDGGAGTPGSIALQGCGLDASNLGNVDFAADASGLYILLGGAQLVARLSPSGAFETISSGPNLPVAASDGYINTLAVNSSTVFWVCQSASGPPGICSATKPP